MSQNSRKRREARRRATGHSQRGQIGGSQGVDIAELVHLATIYAAVSVRSVTPQIDHLNELGASAVHRQDDPAAYVVDEVVSRVNLAWENGWQPLDLVHAAKRQTSKHGANWLARAVLVEGERADASTKAPDDWRGQLAALATRHLAQGADALLPSGGRAKVADWIPALLVLHFLRRLPRFPLLAPPPSQWGQARRPSHTASSGGENSKTLTRIRGLLAKAESTDFPAEAESLTAKAQDLMARYAIDEALLAGESGSGVDVQGVRVLIEQPYALQKAGLLDAIGRANRCRAVWSDFASCVSLVGVPTDLAQVEMLFTSTLVQATRAMTRAGEGSYEADRSTAFRRAFLSAYAVRIGQRLTESTEQVAQTYGSQLVPVFERQAEAIEQEFDRLFPDVTTGSSRAKFDLRGWDAGTQAANDAVLPAGAVES